MSKQLIHQYYNKLERIIQYGGSRNETAIRSALYSLINEYANKKNLELVTEIPIRGTKGANVFPDGVLKNALRLDFGYIRLVGVFCAFAHAQHQQGQRR
jgi:hypothetical protein